MTRRTIRLLVTLALALVVAPLAATARSRRTSPARGPQPLFPGHGHATGDRLGQAMVDAFRQGLQDIGYFEGQTIRLEYRWRRAVGAAGRSRGRPGPLASRCHRHGQHERRPCGPASDGHDSHRLGRRGRFGQGRAGRESRTARREHHGGNRYQPELNGKQLELLKAVVPGSPGWPSSRCVR